MSLMILVFLELNWIVPTLISVSAVLLLIAVILILINIRKKKPKKINVNTEFIDNLVNLLGDVPNIKEVNVDNGRLKITVNDLDLANLDGIKEIAESGVFATGNTIKTLFRLDSATIKKEIDARL